MSGSSDVTLTAVGSAARAVWTSALAGDASAVVSQTPAWLDCICHVGRFTDATRAYRTADGRELALPLAALRDAPAVLGVESSMPFGWSTGGLVGERVRTEDVAAVAADLTRLRRLRVAVRPAPEQYAHWSVAAPAGVARTPRTSQDLDLAGGFSEIWSRRFSTSVRSKCRRAERVGLTVECDDGGRLVGAFDALYRKSVSRWATTQHEPEWLAQWRGRRRDPMRKFDVVAERLGRACCIWLARRSGEPVAAIIVLAHGEHSTYWRGAMDRELVTGTGANELLHRLAIEDACSAGRRWYHMGESAPGSGLAHFKRGFGAVEQPHGDFRFERLPLTAADALLRRQVKRVLRFRD